MPRVKASKDGPPSTTLILDNGANTIKAGYSHDSQPSLVPNSLAKLPSDKTTLVGTQISQCKDFAEMVFRRPVQQGQLVNWEAEREIWSQSFFEGAGSTVLRVDPKETSLLLAGAPNGLKNLTTNTDQMIFEEFEFAAYRRVVGPALHAYADVKAIFTDSPKSDAIGASISGPVNDEVDHTMQADAPEATTSHNSGKLAAECVLVVDSGYSHTTVTPVYKGRPIQQAIRRLEIGGKIITNYLKEMLSVRQLDLSHEFHLVNEMKEDVCYITRNINEDLERTWKQSSRYDSKRKFASVPQVEPGQESAMDIDHAQAGHQESRLTAPAASFDQSIVLDYILPDYTTTFRGRSQPHNPILSKPSAKLQQLAAGAVAETVVTLGNERFAAPELLFSPTDIGLPEAGLPEVIMQSIRAIPPGLWNAMLSNVLAVGGTTSLPGFVERLYDDLRPLVPVECTLRIKKPGDPVTSTWKSGARLVERAKEADRLADVFITRAEYLENGEPWLMRQFAGEKYLPV